jgi:hypothetical protein
MPIAVSEQARCQSQASETLSPSVPDRGPQRTRACFASVIELPLVGGVVGLGRATLRSRNGRTHMAHDQHAPALLQSLDHQGHWTASARSHRNSQSRGVSP